MPPRRTHTKSRTGCSNCKRRKVKCDESFPTCFNCKRQGVLCSLSVEPADESPGTESPKSYSSQPNLLSGTPRSGDKSGFVSPVDPASAAMAAVSEQLAPLPMHELWSKDFELMHHYCTVTADTLSIRREMRHVWRVVIPREGYQHPFVMHGILAIAATHKAYLVPNSRKKYLALSDYHQTVGSEGFRSTLSNVCVESQGALFCFASVVVLFMFTLPTRSATGRLENPVINLLELIGLLKGMRATQSPVLPGILKSEFAPIIYGIWPIEQTGPPAGQVFSSRGLRQDADNPCSYPSLENSLLPLDTWDAIRRLRNFLEAEIPSASLKPYIGAIDRLEETAKLISCAGVHAEAGAVLAWMYGVDDSVLIDIGAYRPHALLTLAYYSLFLATLEKSFWYSRGWGRQLIDQIETKLAGQSKFLQLFQWPKQKLTDLYRW